MTETLHEKTVRDICERVVSLRRERGDRFAADFANRCVQAAASEAIFSIGFIEAIERALFDSLLPLETWIPVHGQVSD